MYLLWVGSTYIKRHTNTQYLKQWKFYAFVIYYLKLFFYFTEVKILICFLFLFRWCFCLKIHLDEIWLVCGSLLLLFLFSGKITRREFSRGFTTANKNSRNWRKKKSHGYSGLRLKIDSLFTSTDKRSIESVSRMIIDTGFTIQFNFVGAMCPQGDEFNKMKFMIKCGFIDDNSNNKILCTNFYFILSPPILFCNENTDFLFSSKWLPPHKRRCRSMATRFS